MRRSVSRLTLASAIAIVPLIGLSPLEAEDKPEKAADSVSADAEVHEDLSFLNAYVAVAPDVPVAQA